MRRTCRTHEARRGQANLHANRSRSSTRTARALIATILAISPAAAATAHALPDAGEETGVDTPHTPIAKSPGTLFTQVAGARWDGDGPSPDDVPPDSPTPFEVDFHAVGARDGDFALAAGSIEDSHERHPIFYRYTTNRGWEEAQRFPGAGYVADIAWIDAERALAVGGSGVYPDRERDDGSSVCDPTQPPPENEAGTARAWLYTEGEGWRELAQLADGTAGDELPDGMSALSAVDFYQPDPEGEPTEFGLAGGLCQLWRFSDGSFAKTPAGEFEAPNRLPRYRVRDISFADPAPSLDPTERRPRAYAVTAGCCLDSEANPTDALNGQPETLTYTVPTGQGPMQGAWSKQTASAALRATTPDSHVSVTATQASVLTCCGAQTGQPDVKGPGRVTSPAGPFDPNEPASQINGRSVGVLSSVRLLDGDGDSGGGVEQLTENELATLCCTYNGNQSSFQISVGGSRPSGPDGIPDWSVGEFSSTDRGIAYGTDPAQLPPPSSAIEPLTLPRACSDGWSGSPSDPGGCAGDSVVAHGEWIGGTLEGKPPTSLDRIAKNTQSSRLLALPSYGLNAIDVLDSESSGWAVGRHGGIVRFAVDADEVKRRRAGAETRTLKIESGALPDRSPWNGYQPPPSSEPGLVPPLYERPSMQLEAPQWQPAVGPVPTVMSSDGSYGWSLRHRRFGSFGQQGRWDPVAYFDHDVWHTCVNRLPGDPPLHPACESYAELKARGIELSGWAMPTVIPTLHDDDPTNDDEFEVVALTASRETPIIRFRDGRWQPEPESALGDAAGLDMHGDSGGSGENFQVAFTEPDDGLIVRSIQPGDPQGPQVTGHLQELHFDGTRWRECTSACDPNELLPFTTGDDGSSSGKWVQLLVMGDRMFAYGSSAGGGTGRPYIVARRSGTPGRDPDASWDASSSGTYYPGADPDSEINGPITTLVLSNRADGGLNGWALGKFWEGPSRFAPTATYNILRLADDNTWHRDELSGALRDDMDTLGGQPSPSGIVVTAGQEPEAFISLDRGARERVYQLDDESRDRWIPSASGIGSRLTADRSGGVYVEGGPTGRSLYRWTDHPPAPVFSEVARPAPPPAPQITRIAAASDGTIWGITESDLLYRYDRASGWDSIHIPGWEPGRVVSAPSPAHAITLDSRGYGLVVGVGGRIAEIAPDRVQLDPAMRAPCNLDAQLPPCGTQSDLRAVAIAEDGSAVAGGDDRSLLWRPAGGDFKAINPPPISPRARFSDVAIADQRTLWVVSAGRVFAGTLEAERWRWRIENLDAEGNLMPIEQLELDSEGHGFAIRGGEHLDASRKEIPGADIFERTPGEQRPWLGMRNPLEEKLTSIALPAGGGPGALIGGAAELVLTWTPNGFAVARPPSNETWPRTGGVAARAAPYAHPVTALALAPGFEPSQIEAWALTFPQVFGAISLEVEVGGVGGSFGIGGASETGKLLHFASDPEEPLLTPERRSAALPDVPPIRPGELAFAALGKSDCQAPSNLPCPEMAGSFEYAEIVLTRALAEIEQRAERGELTFSVWTGDAVDEGSYPGHQVGEATIGAASNVAGVLVGAGGLRKLRRWGELIPDRLVDSGVPMFGTPGVQDLAGVTDCYYKSVGPLPSAGIPTQASCRSHKDVLRHGENLAWRSSMAERIAPWGHDETLDLDGLRYERVSDPYASVQLEDQEISQGEDGDGPRIPIGGAPTHYAIDVEDSAGTEVARLVFVDTSLGSLSGSDPIQNPIEAQGGQAGWLERMLCKAPAEVGGARCSRGPTQRAIVVTNTPTYSYGPGAVRDTLADATAFETILMRHDTDVVVSGRIGWNGRYWATAPGVHEPCPGQGYPEAAPERGVARACGQDAPGGAGQLPGPEAVIEDAAQRPGELGGSAGALSGPLPFVVASGAGGKFADGQNASSGETAEGFWHGYTVVRLDPQGDPPGTIVEQRPVYDYVGIEASSRILFAGERLRLHGFGRNPVGYYDYARDNDFVDTAPITRFDRIDSPAVTHRYDLLEADPEQPWVALRDSDGEQVPLDPKVATIDSTSGAVQAGNGKYPDTFAIATLSVGEHVATYPLLFRKSPSFVAFPLRLAPPVPPTPQATPSPPSPPSPPNPPTPNVPQPSVPQVPTPLGVPPIAASQPPEPQPPAPPAAPPPIEQLSPLNLTLAPPGLAITTPTAVIQPPTPPVNPAPPGGARREARQRQAAAQKSGADNAEEAPDVMEGGGDMAEGRPGSSAMTRRDHAFTRRVSAETPRRAVEPSFTSLPRSEPSAGAQALLYTGGIALLAAALAAGFTTLRPGPRRREPTAPSPAWSRARRVR